MVAVATQMTRVFTPSSRVSSNAARRISPPSSILLIQTNFCLTHNPQLNGETGNETATGTIIMPSIKRASQTRSGSSRSQASMRQAAHQPPASTTSPAASKNGAL